MASRLAQKILQPWLNLPRGWCEGVFKLSPKKEKGKWWPSWPEESEVSWVIGSRLGAQDPPRWGRHVWGRHLLQDALLLGVPAWRNELEGSL